MLKEVPLRPVAARGVKAELTRALATLGDYARLIRLDRPIGALLLLWPTLWALWLAASGHPN